MISLYPLQVLCGCLVEWNLEVGQETQDGQSSTNYLNTSNMSSFSGLSRKNGLNSNKFCMMPTNNVFMRF